MKKKLLLTVITTLLALTLFACSKKDKTNVFVVGFDAEYPPYGYMDENGNYTGFDLELAQEVCKLKGWTFKAQPIVWENKDNELNSGAIDCIWNGFTINGRESLYTWSDPYVDNSQVIVVKTSSGITDFAGLKDKKVAVQAASAALDVLTNSQKAISDTFSTLQQFADYNTAFLELEAGSVDAVAMDVGVAQYQIKSRGNDKFMILSESLNAEKYGIGFKLGNTKLRDEVMDALKTLKENGTFDRLAAKYELSDMVCFGK